MKIEKATFDYKVPATSPVESARGTTVKGTEYEFRVCETDADVQAVLAEKEWTVTELVNDKLKAMARANAYQTALAPHKPSQVSEDDIVERMVRDFVRVGVAEKLAREMVAQAIASK